MTDQEILVNAFLTQVFNDILRLEENALRDISPAISISEMHVLEAVAEGERRGLSMTQVAKALGVTSGTLTVAAKTLVQKGYLERRQNEKDKRRAALCVTPPAREALAVHGAFHERLVRSASQRLSETEMQTLTAAVQKLHEFFTRL